MTDICGICGAGPANFGSIYYVGVSRCGLCLDWEIDNADPLYVKSFKFLDNNGQTKGHGKGTVATDVARTLEGTVATPEPPKRMPRARLETIMSLVLKPKAFGRAKSCSSQRAEGDNRKAKAPKGHADS
jgi:hypothetical protein